MGDIHCTNCSLSELAALCPTRCKLSPICVISHCRITISQGWSESQFHGCKLRNIRRKTLATVLSSNDSIVCVAVSFRMVFKEPAVESSELSSNVWSLQAGYHLSSTFRQLPECIDCTDIKAGQEVHSLVTVYGLQLDNFIGCQIIRMYGFFGMLSEGSYVFGKLKAPDVFSWNAIIAAHVDAMKYELALDLYDKMQKLGSEPNGYIFVTVLKACIGSENLKMGEEVHSKAIMHGLQTEAYVGNALIDLYGKCGSLERAQLLFDKLPYRDVVSWSTLIRGYVEQGHDEKALEVFNQMPQVDIQPNVVTYVSAIRACSTIAALETGRRVHSHIVECGIELNFIIGSRIVDMYIRCGEVGEACIVFNKLFKRGSMSWNAVITGFSVHKDIQTCFKLIEQMQEEKIHPDARTYISIVKSCDTIECIQQVYCNMVKTGCGLDVYVGSSLIHMFGKYGSIDDALIMFEKLSTHNVVTWSALLAVLAERGCGHEAFQCFDQMKREMVDPNIVTLVSMIQACTSAKALEKGKQIHAEIISAGQDSEICVGNALISMYIKCDDTIVNAYKVFDRLHTRNVVSWSALIAGCVQQDRHEVAFGLFAQMQDEGIEPNPVTFVTLLKLCSNITALEHGQRIHVFITLQGFNLEPFMASSLIEMYSKCGCLEDACMVFERLPKQDIVVWTAIIAGHSYNGGYNMAFEYFKCMQLTGLDPDHVSFLCILSACCDGQFVDEGLTQFKSMTNKHNMKPRVEHFNCIVDLLGRSGHLYEAQDLLETIPFGPNIIGCMSLLTSCKTFRDVVLGAQCFNLIVTKDPKNASAYMLMSSIYASANMVEYAKSVNEMRTCANCWKKPGEAVIEIDNQIHRFTVGDGPHEHIDQIVAKLISLQKQTAMSSMKYE